MISVIMSVYNEKIEWLKEAVYSILNQTYTDFEYIIIVDNPSLSIECINFLDKIAADNRVKLHFNDENIGLMRSLNVWMHTHPLLRESFLRGKYLMPISSFADWFARPK